MIIKNERETVSRFTSGAIVVTDPVGATGRRELVVYRRTSESRRIKFAA